MKTAAFIFTIALLFSCNQEKIEIHQWRGENRTGIYSETGLMQAWPDGGPEELWSAEGIGNGYGSPTVTENEIFVTGETDSTGWLYSYALDGSLNWKQQIGAEWAKHYPGSRSAPTVAGDLVYAGTGMGVIACLQRASGELVWSREYVSDFDGELPFHGYSEAPMIVDNRIICTPGGKNNNVVALNRFTGEPIWTCPGLGERMGYNPGNVIELPSQKIFVTFSAYHLLGIDVHSGKLLWAHPQDNTPAEKREPGVGDTHSNNIIFDDGHIYYAAGDGNRGVKLKLSENGDEIEEVWRTIDLDTYMGGFVKMDNFLYGCGTRKKDLKSFDAHTGQVIDSLRAGTGAIIAAENMLYYYNWGGELSLLQCNQGKLAKVGSFKITKGTKEHFSHPVIKNGVLYIRRGDALMAYNIQKNEELLARK